MPRLQRCVLAIIGETEEFACFRFQRRIRLEFDEGADGEDSGGGTAVVPPEGAEFGAFRSLAFRICDPTRRAEAEEEVFPEQCAGVPSPSETTRPSAVTNTGLGKSSFELRAIRSLPSAPVSLKDAGLFPAARAGRKRPRRRFGHVQ
jgi:hypothetical protein